MRSSLVCEKLCHVRSVYGLLNFPPSPDEEVSVQGGGEGGGRGGVRGYEVPCSVSAETQFLSQLFGTAWYEIIS